MNKILRLLTLLSFFLSVHFLRSSEITPLYQLSEILPFVEKDTLVLFDIDDVIVAPHASWLWEQSFLKHKMSSNQLQEMRFPMKYQLVDPSIEELFSSIRKKGGLIAAATARPCIDDNLSIFFMKKRLEFDHPFCGNTGLLACSTKPKGISLFDALLNHPKAILFIDDKKENCESVLESSQAHNVPCQTFLYTGAQSLFQWDIAELQYQEWKKNGILLSDKKAKKLYKDYFFYQRKKSSLLYNLKNTMNPHIPVDSMGNQLWQVHKEWIFPLLEFIQNEAKTEDPSHFIHRFDRNDAREILRPILQNAVQFNLTDDLINQIFYEQIPLYKDNCHSSDIEYFQKEHVKCETLRVAKVAYEHAKGQMIVILGQTPAYIGEMIEVLNRNESSNTKIAFIPFSGRPNITKKPKYKNLWETSYLDIVTNGGEKRFFKLLKKQGISPKKFSQSPKEIFIIDNSTGTSITCFVALLKKYFEYFQVNLPKITFLHMGDEKDFSTLDENGRWIPSKTFDFTHNDYLSFEIPVHFLGMCDEIANAFDSMYDNLRIVPSFNGLFWSKKYLEAELMQYPHQQAKILIQEYRDYAEKNYSNEN